MKNYSSLFLVSLLSGAMTLGAYKLVFEDNTLASSLTIAAPQSHNVSYTGAGAESVDFTSAADKAVHTLSLIHI